MTKERNIIITGANGFIGKALVQYFAGAGWNVRAFERVFFNHVHHRVTHVDFDLENITGEGFKGADVLVHTAYQPILRGARDINIDATRKIIELARVHNVKLIFFSTMSAHNKAESVYGKGKLFAESLFDIERDLVLKLGLVIGEGGGLFGRIRDVLAKSKIIPLIGGSKRIQTIALTDIPKLIESAILKNISGNYYLAHPTPISLKNLYKKIAHASGKKPIFIPVPTVLIYWVLKFSEALKIKVPFTSENVLGTKQLRTFSVKGDVEKFGLALKDLAETFKEIKG